MYKASRKRWHSFCTRSRATGEGHSLRTVDALVVKMHEHPDTPKVKRARSETGGAWSPETIGQGAEQSWSSDEDSVKARSTFSYMVPLTWGMMGKWKTDTQWALLLDCPETPWWSWGAMYTVPREAQGLNTGEKSPGLSRFRSASQDCPVSPLPTPLPSLFLCHRLGPHSAEGKDRV